MEIKKKSEEIFNEANKILYDMNLLDTLERFGEVFITGSYFLNLMTWRDLDIYIKNDCIDKQTFCVLGGEIACILNPHKMNYRDETILKRGLPDGLYWGVYTDIIHDNTWKIDIFAISPSIFQKTSNEAKQLKEKISKEMRKIILEIKQNYCHSPLYRRGIYSVDIYKAVIDDKVRSIEEFGIWLKEKKNIGLQGISKKEELF